MSEQKATARPQTIDINTLTIEQLKAAAYDETLKRDMAQANINALNQKIMEKMTLKSGAPSPQPPLPVPPAQVSQKPAKKKGNK